MERSRKDIKGYSLGSLRSELVKEGFPSFASRQVFNWIYKKRVENFSLMTDLSIKLRGFLKDNFYFSRLTLHKREYARDGTQKFLFYLDDGNEIETVVIPEGRRMTLCVSTQVGCKFRCRFCVSGKDGFVRNLSVSEIINQYLQVEELISPQRITNIVFMGIGEPLDNLKNLLESIRILIEPAGIYFGRRRICVSTCGIVPGIEELMKEDFGVKLSISLHSADDKKRTYLMPVNKKYPLPSVLKVAGNYARKYRFPVTFEYILISGLNSSSDDASQLVRILKRIKKCKVNIIPYNPSKYFKWQAPDEEEISRFREVLKRGEIFFTFRRPRGDDISAACGQLRARVAERGKMC